MVWCLITHGLSAFTITAGNKSHIVESNVVLVGNKRGRHEDIERIINKAERTHRDGTVNADHNSKRTKNRKLKHIAEYVYFETPVMIGDESRSLNQDENLLNLYNVRVKKNNFAGTNTKIVVSHPTMKVSNVIESESHLEG